MLHFDRDAVRPPHLVVLDGAGAERRQAADTRLGPVLLVVVATIVAVVIDLVDTTPRWSPYAVGVPRGAGDPRPPQPPLSDHHIVGLRPHPDPGGVDDDVRRHVARVRTPPSPPALTVVPFGDVSPIR